MVKESNVYVLDDDNSVRRSISRLLRVAGFNVQSYSNVSNFLNELKPNAFGTLVTDLQISGLSVEKLSNELKCRKSNINIIVVSSQDDLESQKIAYDIGAIEFFRKPVDGTALIDSINWALKKKKKKNSNM